MSVLVLYIFGSWVSAIMFWSWVSAIIFWSWVSAEQLILRPEHGIGIAFEIGLIDNDMTIWRQTFVVPLTKVDIAIPCPIEEGNSCKSTNEVPEFDRIAQSLMNDYNNKIKELRSTLQDTQHETCLVYDVTGDVTNWSVIDYRQDVHTIVRENYLHCYSILYFKKIFIIF
jgi:hypothetical protein